MEYDIDPNTVLPGEYIKLYYPSTAWPDWAVMRWMECTSEAEVYTLILLVNID